MSNGEVTQFHIKFNNQAIPFRHGCIIEKENFSPINICLCFLLTSAPARLHTLLLASQLCEEVVVVSFTAAVVKRCAAVRFLVIEPSGEVALTRALINWFLTSICSHAFSLSQCIIISHQNGEKFNR